jgi:hypothetical protein
VVAGREGRELPRGERRRSPKSSPSNALEGEGSDMQREGEGREEDLREDVCVAGRLREDAGGESSLGEEVEGVSNPFTRRSSIPDPFICALYPFSCNAIICIESPRFNVSWKCLSFSLGIVASNGEGGDGITPAGDSMTKGNTIQCYCYKNMKV